jgi:UDP-perosamine 4-acetyltransferase
MAVVVLGAGGQARVLLELMDQIGIAPIAGILDDNPDLLGTRVDGVDVLGTIDRLASFRKVLHLQRAVIAVGDNLTRQRLGELARQQQLRLLSLVHPAAHVSTRAVLGDGTVVLAGAVISAHARVGQLCIINSNATVEHDCLLGDQVHIGPGATLAGTVTVGDRAFIGAGAVVIPDVCIGDEALIGAGAVVVRDVPSRTTVVGCPARALEGRTGTARRVAEAMNR